MKQPAHQNSDLDINRKPHRKKELQVLWRKQQNWKRTKELN